MLCSLVENMLLMKERGKVVRFLKVEIEEPSTLDPTTSVPRSN